tara:strand:- start:4801 stop:5913 length:1113 start_codon:yes stop_codon:yes gene_type:complete
MAKYNIPFFNYKSLYAENKKELLDIFDDVSGRGAFIMQSDLSEFESNLCLFTGAKYSLGVANATDALELLLIAGGITLNNEVIICSHTMIATASAIKSVGAIPIPIEAGIDHLMDVNLIENAITENTKAIMPTQLNGRVCNMDVISEIAKKYELKIIEDSAQALGASYKNKAAGTFGLGGCISFYPAKVLGCFGDGGAILTNNEEIYNTVKLLRDHGRADDGNISIWGFNSRLDNLQAAILNFFLKKFDFIIERRRSIANQYNERLKILNSLVLPPPPLDDSNHFDIFQNYEIEVDNRDDFREYLSSNGIGTLIQWGGNAVHEFKDLGFEQSLPFTEAMMRRSIMLPLNMSLTDEELDYICNTIERYFNG